MSTAVHVFKLRVIWARVHSTLFSDTSSLKVEDPVYQVRIKQLRTDLEN